MAWINRKLSDVCRLINGRAYKKHEMLSEGPYPLLRVGNFFTNRGWYYSDLELDSDKYCDDGDLLYAWSASFGPRIWDGGKVIYHYHIWKIELDEELVDKNYLYYLLDWDKELIKSEQGAGTTMVHVTKGSMENRILPFPSVAEQKRIVAILDQAFAEIDKARATAETNLKNARELFDSYLKQVFSQRGEEWKQEKMSEVCEGKITDGTHQTPKYFDDGFIFLSSKNVTSGVIDWDDVKYLDESQHIEMQKRLSPKLNDILLAKNGTTGVAAIVDKEEIFNIYVSLALLRPSKKIEPRYLLHFVNSPLAKEQFNKRLKGVGVPNLHLNEIREVIVTYPECRKKQQEIVNRIDTLLNYRVSLEDIYHNKLNAMSELKKSILQKAFTGELTKSKGIAA